MYLVKIAKLKITFIRKYKTGCRNKIKCRLPDTFVFVKFTKQSFIQTNNIKMCLKPCAPEKGLPTTRYSPLPLYAKNPKQYVIYVPLYKFVFKFNSQMSEYSYEVKQQYPTTRKRPKNIQHTMKALYDVNNIKGKLKKKTRKIWIRKNCACV